MLVLAVDKVAVKRARREQGEPPPDDVVEWALSQVDQAAITAEEDAKLAYEVWDKVSPINGVPAERFLKRFDVDPEAEIYLLREPATGHVVYFQPHLPHISGHVRMTPGTVHGHAEAHRREVVQERAQARIMRRVMDILDGE